ncbi:MAG TPA: Holliday junction resolvase RuvX [Mycobacteriales bacterium]|nr:Holliday junction resolvase RuvX [Mycobacteriales bacterium]
MRSGVRLGVDVGTVRVGVAACDPGGVLAYPLTVLRRDPRGDRDLGELEGLAAEHEAIEIVVGLPRSLSGREGPAAVAVRDYAAALARRVAPLPVRLVDERLSTTQASGGLRAAGKSSRAQREIVDAAAAVVVLQAALDGERAIGRPAGEVGQ